MATQKPTRAIDILKAAYSKKLRRHEITLNNGVKFEFWMSQLNLAERNKAREAAAATNPADVNMGEEVVFQLLLMKAKTAAGVPLFTAAEVVELRNECDSTDIQQLQGALFMPSADDEVIDQDMKSTSKADQG